jgi:hypothetical protein
MTPASTPIRRAVSGGTNWTGSFRGVQHHQQRGILGALADAGRVDGHSVDRASDYRINRQDPASANA